jgi:hypothetical protein
MFAVMAGFLLVETGLGVVEVIPTKQTNKFVVLAEFYPRVTVHHAVVLETTMLQVKCVATV